MVETDATTDATTPLAPSIALVTIAVTPSSPVGGAKVRGFQFLPYSSQFDMMVVPCNFTVKLTHF